MKLFALSAAFLCQLVLTNGWIPAPTGRTTTRTPSGLHSTAATSLPRSGVYTLDGEEIRGPITPLHNFIIVRVKDTLVATEGGILLPDQSQEKPTEGTVVAAGPGKVHPFTAVRIDNPIKEGMSVVYGKFDGTSVNYNEEPCQVIKDDNVLLYYEGVTMKLGNTFPVRDYVLIKLDDDKKSLATSSGVVIAQQVMADDLPCMGEVIKVGEGRMSSKGELTKPPVEVGERVKFKDYAGNDIMLEGKQYSVVKMVDILGSQDM
jgi:chaperonin GroES